VKEKAGNCVCDMEMLKQDGHACSRLMIELFAYDELHDFSRQSFPRPRWLSTTLCTTFMAIYDTLYDLTWLCTTPFTTYHGLMTFFSMAFRGRIALRYL